MKFRRNLDNYLDKIQTKFRQNLVIFRRNLDNNLDNNLDKIQTKFRQNLDKFRQNLDNAQKIQSMSYIDIFEKKLDKIQTCQKKFRQNLDIFRTLTKFVIQTNLEPPGSLMTVLMACNLQSY